MHINPISGERPLSLNETTSDVEEAKKPSPIGIAAHRDSIISKTPLEYSKEDFSSGPKGGKNAC